MNRVLSISLWVGATLLLAAAVHAATLYALPNIVMRTAIARIGAPNTIHHVKRADATSRGVVRPSPDLLYSICPFDLSDGPLRVSAPVPADTYWSVSAFDGQTNNFFVKNDKQISGKTDFILAGPGTDMKTLPANVVHVQSPTMSGLVLFRTLIFSERDFARIDTQRRQATCAPMRARPPEPNNGG
ncbi:MAG TPA: DUF1254 domain-containing protein [Rhizomicrobium sp.]|nr:DUF1254 domain-containing protein [Rhizomicrobium sp.]